ncbi:hypothetical protein COY87_01615, partial [Candidatus Roizmanbacteria bacterium CG_4_10_14_0_8_um_filter_33_9]
MKKIAIYFLIFFAFLSISQFSYAKDIFIVLDDTTPSFQQVDNFFNTDDMLWAPGKEETKTLIIHNNTDITQYILFSSINREDSFLVSQAMHILITNQSGKVLYSNSLYSFISQGEKLIDSIDTNTTETIIFHVQMYESAGNKYQNSYLHYDLGIDLLDPIEYVTPTPIPCNAKTPPSISQLTLGKLGSNQILLEWSKVYQDEEKDSSTQDLVTGHSVMYATNDTFNPFIQQYLGKTNQFIANNLDLNTNRYYFKVKTINDCQEGKWSSIISAGISPTLTPTPTITPLLSNTIITIAPELSPTATIEKVVTSSFIQIPSIIKDGNNDNKATQSTSTGQVQGVKTKICIKIWWQILLIQFIALLFILFGKHQFKKTR